MIMQIEVKGNENLNEENLLFFTLILGVFLNVKYKSLSKNKKKKQKKKNTIMIKKKQKKKTQLIYHKNIQ